MFVPFHGQRSTILGLTQGNKATRDKITVSLAIFKLIYCSFFVGCHYCSHQGKKVEFFALKFFEKLILGTETEGKAFVKIHVLFL